MGQESFQMMRISVVQSTSQRVTLRIEGEVKGRWVAELGRACEEALSRDIRLDLDLADVSFVDIDGINLFRALMDRQVAFTNPCPFIAEQLGVSR
jgi:ABC-type transporter Mla MlaB component